MAVLPTPGSPMSTGLFFVRRLSTWMTRRISSSRPMTGSILPSRARWVRSCPYFSSAAKFSSGFWLVTRWLPRTSFSACSSSSLPMPSRWFMASSRCSTERKSSFRSFWYGDRVLDDVVELAVHAWLAAAVGLGQLGDRLVGLVAHHQRGEAQLGQHGRDDGVVLAHERGHQVVGGELGVAERLRLVDGRGEGLVGLEGPLLRIERHEMSLHA